MLICFFGMKNYTLALAARLAGCAFCIGCPQTQ
jgi:hypothetical protein